MKDLSLERMINIINEMDSDTMFLVPSDIFGHVGNHVTKCFAAEELKKYHHYWTKHNENTTFTIYGVSKQNVWIPSEQKYKVKDVIKISMNNNSIAEFAINMNTIND